MVEWHDGLVATEDSVAVASAPSGAVLRDAYIESLRVVTFGLVGMRSNAVVLGPLELLRFGAPKITAHAVEWPIQGGLLARRPGGRWRIEAKSGHVKASASGYTPRLPRPIYALTHLQVHLLFTRLFLLRLRGREPSRGVPATTHDRRRAAAVDVAFCFMLASLTGRRHQLRRTVVIATAYHIACWSISGRTLGGLVTRQRVVAVDGSRLTPTQALFRLALLPLSWIARRPVHDELAATEVIAEAEP